MFVWNTSERVSYIQQTVQYGNFVLLPPVCGGYELINGGCYWHINLCDDNNLIIVAILLLFVLKIESSGFFNDNVTFYVTT
jgi:hypothetical protein